ncbi:MAG: MiaB/RimO family radical SAM methylthiotransferase [Vicinamibacterales bacterium]
MKYAIVTFGCRVNQADSLAIEGQLRERGGVAAAVADADLLVVNTCSVTAGADQGARQTIRRAVRGNPDVKVIVTGCYATRQPDDVAALPNVIHVVANPDKERLVGRIVSDAPDGPCGRPLEPGVGGRTALSLRVQTGCEERCSYCIIPTTRGASRSKTVAAVLDDVRRGIDAGYQEFWITGVHLGSFGRDGESGENLLTLLQALAAREEDVLFRVSSLEPMDCSPAIVDLVAASPRLAPHFHLPLQHASDEMLSAMRRPYTAAYYEGLVARVHEQMPHASIGTDLIVGFPGETSRHFEAMHDAVERLPFSYVHVFPYSDRPGTAASRLGGRVDGASVRERGAAIRSIGAAKARAFREAQTGTTRRALVVDDGRSAVTDNYLKVKLEEPRERNTWVEIVI